MKTTSQAIKDSNIDANLIRSVVRTIGDKESLQDVYNHGADAGFCGFTYYNDTVKFFKAHRQAIVELVENMANDLGETPVDMVGNFNCLRSDKRESMPSISRCLYGGRLTDDDTIVANALAWFALEEIARAFCD